MINPQLAKLAYPDDAAALARVALPPLQEEPLATMSAPDQPLPKVVLGAKTHGPLAHTLSVADGMSGPVFSAQAQPDVRLDPDPQHQIEGHLTNKLQAAYRKESQPKGFWGKTGDAIANTLDIHPTRDYTTAMEKQLSDVVGQESQNQYRQAETEHAQQETDNLKNPKDKFSPLATEQGYQAFDPSTGRATPLTTTEGKPLEPFSPTKTRSIDEMAYDSLVTGGKTPIQALDTIYGAKNTKVDDLPHLYLDALQSGDKVRAALIKKAHEDTQVKPAAAAPGVTMIIPDGKGGGTVQRLAPGQTVAPGAMTPAGVSSLNVPTSSTRTMVETAPRVIELADRAEQLIDPQVKTLGPAASRWAEFMAGKVGAPNPEFTKLRTNIGLLTTALMRMHVGARGGEQIMEHFQQLIDSSRQDPQNLKAALDEIKNYAHQVAGEAGPGHGGTANPSNDTTQPQRPAHVPEGYIFKDGAQGKGWYKPNAAH